MSPQTDGGRIIQMICCRPAASRDRIMVIAGILRDLLAADETDEAEIAFTLVMAELADDGFTLDTRKSFEPDLSLKCTNCGESVDKHKGLGMPCALNQHKFNCPSCGRVFGSELTLANHFEAAHSQAQRDSES